MTHGLEKLFDEAEANVVGEAPVHPDATFETIDPITGEYELVVEGKTVIPNDSGIVPTEFKVLVLPDEPDIYKRYRAAGLQVANADQYKRATTTGIIVAMSPVAFSYHDWPEGTRLPRVGDRVVFGRYAGMEVKGRPFKNEKGHEEQQEYWLLNDKDVAGILDF